jgi:hypothetical protein
MNLMIPLLLTANPFLVGGRVGSPGRKLRVAMMPGPCVPDDELLEMFGLLPATPPSPSTTSSVSPIAGAACVGRRRLCRAAHVLARHAVKAKDHRAVHQRLLETSTPRGSATCYGLVHRARMHDTTEARNSTRRCATSSAMQPARRDGRSCRAPAG